MYPVITLYVIAWRLKDGAKMTVKAFEHKQGAEDWCAKHAVPHIAIRQVDVPDQQVGV
ncbi:MAG: hypothetical protein PHS32_17400 [Rhodoferax sp.]|uniref:hypothetical protein n=1 Tax=Rhodoferax sp. TaxID=50421 RepID=UPI0026134544|nr:hypothetical protein [Rhodoferax sp.]MDD5335510.1 hypothetical protein [Rhodoferax sp.]